MVSCLFVLKDSEQFLQQETYNAHFHANDFIFGVLAEFYML